MAGAGQLTYVMRVTCLHPGQHDRAEKHQIRYLFKRRVHFVLHTIQSHSAGLSLRVRGVYIASWRGGGLIRPRDPDHGAAAAAATNARQPRARARSGGGEGWNVETSYILLDDERT